MNVLAKETGDLLHKQGLSLGMVESATGGLISHLITNIPGSSDYFKGGITAYSNQTKINIVGVRAETIAQYGAVSSETAAEMARGGRDRLQADICLSDTGIAGPGGETTGKPVGLFFIGLAYKSGTETRKHVFSGSREENKQTAAASVLNWLKEYLLDLE